MFLSFGISDPVTTQNVSSTPIFGQTGVNVFGHPTYDVTGSDVSTSSITQYTRRIVLNAVDGKAFRETNTTKPLWKTTIVSTGQTGSLRPISPIMMGAATKHIGTNTGNMIRVELTADDKKVLAVKP